MAYKKNSRYEQREASLTLSSTTKRFMLLLCNGSVPKKNIQAIAFSSFQLKGPFGFVVSGRSLTVFYLLSEPSYKRTFPRHCLIYFG